MSLELIEAFELKRPLSLISGFGAGLTFNTFNLPYFRPRVKW